MKIRINSFFYTVLPVLFLLSSCKQLYYDLPGPSAYISNVSNVNTTITDLEFNSTLLPGGNHLENQNTFSLRHNHAVQFNTYLSYGQRFLLNEAAWSYRKPLKGTDFITISAGYGYGSTRYKEERDYQKNMSSSFPHYRKLFDLRSSMHKFYVQPSYANCLPSGLTYAFGCRLSAICFPRYYYSIYETSSYDPLGPVSVLRNDIINIRNKFSFLFEPSFTIRKQKKHLGFFFQVQFCLPLSRPDILNKHYLLRSNWPLLSLGLNINVRR